MTSKAHEDYPNKHFSVMNDIKTVALRIAEEANKCCHRSDGYEEDIAEFAEKEIRQLLSYKYSDDVIDESRPQYLWNEATCNYVRVTQHARSTQNPATDEKETHHE